MAAHNWQLFNQLNEARALNRPLDVQRLELEIAASQAACSHVPNPEAPERCYECGYRLARPGIRKTSPEHEAAILKRA